MSIKNERLNKAYTELLEIEQRIVASDSRAAKCSKLGIDFKTQYPADAAEYTTAVAEYNAKELEIASILAEVDEEEDVERVEPSAPQQKTGMLRISGSATDFLPIKQVGSQYIISWDLEESEGAASWMQATLNHLPTITELRELITNYYNGVTDRKILSGFAYNGYQVWLSLEDQMNYKGAYDLCVQTQGQGVLPITIKIGTTDNPHYETFETVDSFTAFYLSMFGFVQQTLAAGWAKKDAVDYEQYEAALRELTQQDE